MKRPLTIWLAFGCCSVIVFATMGWLSWTVLRLDQAQQRSQHQQVLEENVRLALWRMDSAMVPMLTQESARPYFAYTALKRGRTPGSVPFYGAGEVFETPPLLHYESRRILLHFQVDSAGEVSSPQVPEEPLEGPQTERVTRRLEENSARLARLQEIVSPNYGSLTANCAPPKEAQQYDSFQELVQAAPQGPATKGRIDAQARAFYSNQAVQQQALLNAPAITDSPGIHQGIAQTMWLGHELILARQVVVEGQFYLQGAWLNWAVIREELLESVEDLLPVAKLHPVAGEDNGDPTRMLATLPARLLPGSVQPQSASMVSPLRLSLGIAWGCVLLAAVAVAVLLGGILSLSERRAAFVSAVTHELRTPLTTFRMYTQMLADGMISDEGKRTQYLARLRTESDRLGHLLDNVLAYARLEGTRRGNCIETVRLDALLERVQNRLAERARQAGMDLALQPGDSARTSLSVDASAVEQILFNLVDNACKYAAEAQHRLIDVHAGRANGLLRLRVRDYGPGIDARDGRRLFKPFSKSDREAAHSAPGVGLGLALSRNLARQMGGDLTLDTTVTDGACFVLSLPVEFR